MIVANDPFNDSTAPLQDESHQSNQYQFQQEQVYPFAHPMFQTAQVVQIQSQPLGSTQTQTQQVQQQQQQLLLQNTKQKYPPLSISPVSPLSQTQPQQQQTQQQQQQQQQPIQQQKPVQPQVLQKQKPQQQQQQQQLQKLELSQLEDIDLADAEEIKKPNYNALRTYIVQRHPTKTNGQEYSACEAISFETGSHGCILGGSSEKSQMDKFGVAITLYFRFLKNLICWFLLFAILSIIPLAFYVKYQQYYSHPNPPASPLKAYSDTSLQFSASEKLLSTTIGSLAIDSMKCEYMSLHDPSKTVSASEVDSNVLYFACKTGVLPSTVDSYSYGFDVDSSCNADSSALNTLISGCYGKSECQVKIDETIFKSNTNCDAIRYVQDVYFSTSCENMRYTMIWEFNKSTVVVIASVIDAAIVILFLYFLIRLKGQQNSTEKSVISNSVSASYFTLEIRNLPQNLTHADLRFRLQHHVENVICPRNDGMELKVFDIQLSQSRNIVEQQRQLRDLRAQKLHLIFAYCNEYHVNVANAKVNMQTMIMASVGPKLSDSEQKQAQQKLEEIQRISKEIVATQTTIDLYERSENEEVSVAWVTFETMQMRDKAYSAMNRSLLERTLDIICGICIKPPVDHRYFEGRMLKVSSAPQPENIKWSNLSLSFCSKFCRRLLSILITLFFLFATLVLIVWVKQENQSYNNKYPSVSCPKNSAAITKEEVAYDFESSISKGLLECYCQIDTISKMDNWFTLSSGEQKQLCQIWLSDKSIILILPFIVVLVIIIINYVLTALFRVLSRLEGYSSITTEVSSRVAKIFIMQFMNTALIILIMNAKIIEDPSDSSIGFLLSGTFADFEPLWFKTVGSTIMLTMVFYIVMPYVDYLFSQLSVGCVRFYDRKFSTKQSVTRQKTQKAYQEIYLGPQFLLEIRYAQIMTILFVCLFYSTGIPGLLFTTFFYLISAYYVDKFFILRLCKTPPNYGKELEKFIRSICFLAIPCHCVLGIWMLGSKRMFAGAITYDMFDSLSQTITNYQSASSGDASNIFEEFFSRSVEAQNIPQLLLLVLFVFYLIIQVLRKKLCAPIMKCLCCCFTFNNEELVAKHNAFKRVPLVKFINMDDLQSQTKILKERLKDATDMKKPLLKNQLEKLTAEISRKQELENNGNAIATQTS